ncbi:unnamed protein product [Strongylus vulgaris]|uniref:Uncharacterized protein n=1 Tax=Strongylus vulgaris TaxID=40348 RepID=A0A3P7IJQ4_STRVU|nr:unnamed protein product [Strongylus vulgaris]
MLPDDLVRDGIVFEFDNYFEFLRYWLDESNKVLVRLNATSQPKRIEDTITPTTLAEKSRIVLPAGVFNRSDLLHCDMVIKGLPPCVFFGSGFGHRASLARVAAAKDLVDKCCRVGLLTEALHASIGDHPFFKRMDLPKRDYSLAVDALVDLDKKMCKISWPWDIYSAREVEQDVLDRLQTVFDSVMGDVYLRDPNQRRIWNGLMKTSGSKSPGLSDSQSRTGFCRRCKLRSHCEQDCRGDFEERKKGPSNSTALPIWNAERRYERGRNDQYYPYWDDQSNSKEYTPDEIASKIAQQREELLRREMIIRNSAEGETPFLAHASLSQSALSHRRSSLSDPLMPNEQENADRKEDELRARLAAETFRMEEELRLKEKERELERRLKQEFEEKKRTLEEEIRKQVQLEERAKLQMELAQQRTLQVPSQSFSMALQYPGTSSMPPASFATYGEVNFNEATYGREGAECGGEPGPSSYTSAPDFELEEIKRLIKETEEKLLDLQRNAREAELSVIFQSRAFQTVSELGDNAYLLDRNQKQFLLRELKELLSHAGPKERELKTRERYDRHSAEKSRRRSTYRHHGRTSSVQSRSLKHQSNYKHSKKAQTYKEVRHQIGGITLRNLTPVEQRHLKVRDIVVAHDDTTGKWTTAHVAKISGDTATLTVGNATWKKGIQDLFKEVNEWS